MEMSTDFNSEARRALFTLERKFQLFFNRLLDLCYLCLQPLLLLSCGSTVQVQLLAPLTLISRPTFPLTLNLS